MSTIPEIVRQSRKAVRNTRDGRVYRVIFQIIIPLLLATGNLLATVLYGATVPWSARILAVLGWWVAMVLIAWPIPVGIMMLRYGLQAHHDCKGGYLPALAISVGGLYIATLIFIWAMFAQSRSVMLLYGAEMPPFCLQYWATVIGLVALGGMILVAAVMVLIGEDQRKNLLFPEV